MNAEDAKIIIHAAFVAIITFLGGIGILYILS